MADELTELYEGDWFPQKQARSSFRNLLNRAKTKILPSNQKKEFLKDEQAAYVNDNGFDELKMNDSDLYFPDDLGFKDELVLSKKKMVTSDYTDYPSHHCNGTDFGMELLSLC